MQVDIKDGVTEEIIRVTDKRPKVQVVLIV